MFRTMFLAAALAGSLGGAALAAPPVSAAPVAAAAGQPALAGQGLVAQAQYYGLRRYRRPRCFWADRRVWNGWRWVVRPVRICR